MKENTENTLYLFIHSCMHATSIHYIPAYYFPAPLLNRNKEMNETWFCPQDCLRVMRETDKLLIWSCCDTFYDRGAECYQRTEEALFSCFRGSGDLLRRGDVFQNEKSLARRKRRKRYLRQQRQQMQRLRQRVLRDQELEGLGQQSWMVGRGMSWSTSHTYAMLAMGILKALG